MAGGPRRDRRVRQAGVVFTGHSLGGALAAFRADRAGHPVAAIYTYGQPRVGHRDFSRAYSERLEDRTYRAINHVDLVTRVPLLLQGYRHVGSRIYFDRGGTAHLGDEHLAGRPRRRHLPVDPLGTDRRDRRPPPARHGGLPGQGRRHPDLRERHAASRWLLST